MEIIENKVSSGVKVEVSEEMVGVKGAIRRWGRPRVKITLPKSDVFSTAEIKSMNPDVWTKSMHDRLREMIKHNCITREDIGTYKITDRELATKIGANMYNIFKTSPNPFIKRGTSGGGAKPRCVIYLPKEKTFRAKEFCQLNPDRGTKTLHNRINVMLKSGSLKRIDTGVYEIINRQMAAAICNGVRAEQVANMPAIKDESAEPQSMLKWAAWITLGGIWTYFMYKLFLSR